MTGAGSTQTGGGSLDMAVYQLTPAGELDPTFNPRGPTPGILVVDIAGGNDAIRGFDIDSTGRAVLAGRDLATTKTGLAGWSPPPGCRAH